jgi:hypothetical protein
MAEDRRKQAFRIGTRQRVVVGVADAGSLDLDQYFTGARAAEFDLLDRQWLSCFPGNSGFGFHDDLDN